MSAAAREITGCGEFPLSREDFHQIASILYADAGIALSEHKMPLVYGRLIKRLRALGLQSFKDYCALVASQEGGAERQSMMAALTTNVTRFMREPHHFDHLRQVTLPPLARLARQGRPVRLWSAGCSSGQEPYSIALTLLGVMPEAANLDVRILATDIDPGMIADGRRGRYSEEDVGAISHADRTRWFEPVGTPGSGDWLAGDALRRLVAFRELNLIGAWPMRGRFDVIFCRNVMIYFDEETRERLWARFAAALNPGGLLCTGHSERVSGPAKDRLRAAGPTMFQLAGAA